VAAGRWPEWIVGSHAHFVGGVLCAPGELYDWRSVVLCHDRSADPVLVYANRAAQALWERPWEDFVGRPSRITAPPGARAERAVALSADGVVHGYSGERVSATGRLFRILDACVWPVVDDDLRRVGQAASFLRVEQCQA
jgi:hypothetical protein